MFYLYIPLLALKRTLCRKNRHSSIIQLSSFHPAKVQLFSETCKFMARESVVFWRISFIIHLCSRMQQLRKIQKEKYGLTRDSTEIVPRLSRKSFRPLRVTKTCFTRKNHHLYIQKNSQHVRLGFFLRII